MEKCLVPSLVWSVVSTVLVASLFGSGRVLGTLDFKGAAYLPESTSNASFWVS